MFFAELKNISQNLLMAMINIKEGTLVFVPWRIQGIVRNEERLLSYSIHLLEKQNKYLLNCITRDQIMATNKLDRFTEKFNKAPRVSTIMAKAKKRIAADNKRTCTAPANRRQAPPPMNKPWQPRQALPAMVTGLGKPQAAPPLLQKQQSQRMGFLPRSPKERQVPQRPLPRAVKKIPQWPTLTGSIPN